MTLADLRGSLIEREIEGRGRVQRVGGGGGRRLQIWTSTLPSALRSCRLAAAAGEFLRTEIRSASRGAAPRTTHAFYPLPCPLTRGSGGLQLGPLLRRQAVVAERNSQDFFFVCFLIARADSHLSRTGRMSSIPGVVRCLACGTGRTFQCGVGGGRRIGTSCGITPP